MASVLHVLFLPVDLVTVGAASVLEPVLGTVNGGVVGSPSNADPVCALATLRDVT